MLICTPGECNKQENIGNVGTVVRYNISRNDHTRAFYLSGGEHTTVAGNAIYVGPGIDLQMLAVTNWKGWASDAVFRNNIFWVLGTARYGYERKRNQFPPASQKEHGSSSFLVGRKKPFQFMTGLYVHNPGNNWLSQSRRVNLADGLSAPHLLCLTVPSD